MPCLGIGKELAKHRPHLFFLLITCNAADNGGDLAHIAANGSDKLSISGIEVVKPVFLPQGLRFLSKHLLSLPPMFCGVCVFQHLRKLQHDSCRLQVGRCNSTIRRKSINSPPVGCWMRNLVEASIPVSQLHFPMTKPSASVRFFKVQYRNRAKRG